MQGVSGLPKRTVDFTAPFQTIDNASRITGMSRDFIRKGVRNGRIPFIRSGGANGNSAYMVNVPLFLQQLEAESRAAMLGVSADAG